MNVKLLIILKIGFPHILVVLLTMLLASSCAVKKNTWSERAMASLNTRYNVYFNGRQSYDEALRLISAAQKDDYGSIIPMYPISNHDNAKAATTQLNRTIEKSRKAIKTRSLKIKPKDNPSKRRDPAYRAFMDQEEYNPYMSNVWMLLAQAEFHQAEFLGAVGTFNYIARHFKEDQDLVLATRLWVVRAYAEMGWLYEAEDILNKLDQKALRGDNVSLYAAVYADLLLKKGQYREAIPFVEMTLNREKSKQMRHRLSFLLAQLYEHSGNKQAAYQSYTQLIRKSPPFEMDLNARLSRAGLFIGSMSDIRRELNRMIRNYNNRDYLDQIYYTLGRSYLHVNDTVKALHYFDEAVEYSTRNGVDKAKALIVMGDLHFLQKRYVRAQPAYDEASKIITVDHYEYPRVSKRSEILADLVVQYEAVQLQDSLQRLSAMSETERLESIMGYIAHLQREEELAAEREAKRQERNDAASQMELSGFGTMPPMGGGMGGAEWYFYNPMLIRSGQTEFQQRWGRRRLEDNWRRSSKSAVMFDEDELKIDNPPDEEVTNNETVAGEEGDMMMGEISQPGNQPDLSAGLESEAVADRYNPEFYLRQIPITQEQLALSNLMWAEALYKLGRIYQDRLEDFPLAIATFRDYLERFATYEHAIEALYNSYLLSMRMDDESQAEVKRLQIIDQFPETLYAQMLSDRDYIAKKRNMYVVQDSVYTLAYNAYNRSEFTKVFEQVAFIQKEYPLSTLMPKFLFLKALSVGKTSPQEAFEKELTALLEAYPQSDVSSMTKDILALMLQGRESQQGTTHGTMLARREQELVNENGNGASELTFNRETNGAHRLILIAEATEEALFPLQFQLAVYNFSRFLVRDFELNIATIAPNQQGLSVYEFENYDEAEWYLSSIREEEALQKLMNELRVKTLLISEYNYGILRAGRSLTDYLYYQTEEAEANAQLNE